MNLLSDPDRDAYKAYKYQIKAWHDRKPKPSEAAARYANKLLWVGLATLAIAAFFAFMPVIVLLLR